MLNFYIPLCKYFSLRFGYLRKKIKNAVMGLNDFRFLHAALRVYACAMQNPH